MKVLQFPPQAKIGKIFIIKAYITECPKLNNAVSYQNKEACLE